MQTLKTEVVVVGGGPGGYAAAFYAADMGKQVILVDKDVNLGGVCLNRGCIPSKALLNATKVLLDAKSSEYRGISFSKPQVDLEGLRNWKNSVISKLNQGIAGLAKKRKVQVVTGRGYFESSTQLRVETSAGQQFIEFEKAIVAVGSRPALPAVFDLGNPRIMTSTEALDMPEIPETLLVVGGGYIGMELSTVYSALGSKVTVVEAMDTILAGADSDLVRPVMNYAKSHFEEVRLGAKVSKMATAKHKIKVNMDYQGKSIEELYDRVLVSVGRVPNSQDLGVKNTKATLNDKGFFVVDAKQQTTDPNIYAIGDIAGGVLLAHKASREARIAVDALLGETPIAISDVVIPAVVFTNPEVAWCGLTENEAKSKGIQVKVSKFPWSANGRALTFDKPEGLTKIIADPITEKVLGVGIVGAGAGDLISEAVVAIEMGAVVKDLAMSVHPHPTLAETMMESAEVYYGHCTHS
jgi:dihydrolipoamide dehydrogenase